MVEVIMKFKKLTKEKLEHIRKAETELEKAGVTFDSSMDCETSERQWELDWSLKGAEIELVKKPNKSFKSV